MVALWVENEINAATGPIVANGFIEDPDMIIAEIAAAICFDTIPAPQNIFHIAAAANNIPLYTLFARKRFSGQDERFDALRIDHETNGLLPWEVAVVADPKTIGVVAKQCYAEWMTPIKTSDTRMLLDDDVEIIR